MKRKTEVAARADGSFEAGVLPNPQFGVQLPAICPTVLQWENN